MPPTMRSGFSRLCRAAVLATLLLAASVAGGFADALPPSVLLLASYQHGDAWSDGIVAGFLDALPAVTARVFVEYLDTRRWPAAETNPEFRAYLAAKYRDIPLALAAGADDAALDFLMANREQLFPDRPIVFCGVNDFSPKRLAGQSGITGVSEAPDILGALELALGLFPSARVVMAFGADTSATGRANLERFRRAMQALSPRARAVEILDAGEAEARAALAGAPRDAVVLHLSPLSGPDGLLLPLGSDLEILTASGLPVFVLWGFDLRPGVLGGRLVRGGAQGRAAAALVREILDGRSPADIPVRDGPAETVIDYRVMERFGLNPADLPKKTVLLNEPTALYERHKLAFWSGGAALFVSLPAAVWLAILLAARRRTEARLAESERRYRQLVESAHALILRFDQTGRLVFVNDYAERLLGYSRQELLGGGVRFWPPAPINLSGLLARAMTAPETLAGDIQENEVTARDGRRVCIHWDNQPLLGDGGRPEGWLAVGTDVTARRRAEEALASRALAEEELSAFGRELLADAPGAISRALRRLLTAFGAARALWYENTDDPVQGPGCRLAGEARTAGLSPAGDNPGAASFSYTIDGYLLADAMLAGEGAAGLAEDFPEGGQKVLAALDFRGFMAAPVTVNGVWSGFLVVGEGRAPRRFSRQEQTLLSTAASLLSAHLSRPRAGAG